jgi:hypothetical protein
VTCLIEAHAHGTSHGFCTVGHAAIVAGDKARYVMNTIGSGFCAVLDRVCGTGATLEAIVTVGVSDKVETTPKHIQNAMTEDIELIYSPLQQTITKDGHTIDVKIFRSPDSQWVLEVVNAAGTSTCWDGEFPTDQAAFNEVLRTIDDEGITARALDDPAKTLN